MSNKTLKIGDKVRVQPSYRHAATERGTVIGIELMTTPLLDKITVKLIDGKTLETARHLVHK